MLGCKSFYTTCFSGSLFFPPSLVRRVKKGEALVTRQTQYLSTWHFSHPILSGTPKSELFKRLAKKTLLVYDHFCDLFFWGMNSYVLHGYNLPTVKWRRKKYLWEVLNFQFLILRGTRYVNLHPSGPSPTQHGDSWIFDLLQYFEMKKENTNNIWAIALFLNRPFLPMKAVNRHLNTCTQSSY